MDLEWQRARHRKQRKRGRLSGTGVSGRCSVAVLLSANLLLGHPGVAGAAPAEAGNLSQPAAPEASPATPTMETPTEPPREDAAAAETLSLSEAVAYALEHNPRIGGAAAVVQGARAVVGQNRALRGPQLGVNNYYFRQGPVVPSLTPGRPPSVPGARWNYGAFLSQVLYDWGERGNRQRASKAAEQAASRRLDETRNDVQLVVTVAYYNVLRAQELLEVAEERRTAAAEQLRVTQARFQEGVTPRFDVVRSEAELANAEQDVISAQNDLDLAKTAFNTALGREVETPVNLEPAPESSLVTVPFEHARKAAAENRPLLQALRQDIAASERELKARRAESRPQLGLNSTYDRPNQGGFASTLYRYSFGMVMNWSFFDSGLIRSRVRQAQASLEGGRQALEEARQQVELDVRQSLLDMSEAWRRRETSQKEQVAAREALRVAEVRYRAGVGTNVEVTDAQVALARAGQNVANAQFDYETALARLAYATGVPLTDLAATETASAAESGEKNGTDDPKHAARPAKAR